MIDNIIAWKKFLKGVFEYKPMTKKQKIDFCKYNFNRTFKWLERIHETSSRRKNENKEST